MKRIIQMTKNLFGMSALILLTLVLLTLLRPRQSNIVDDLLDSPIEKQTKTAPLSTSTRFVPSRPTITPKGYTPAPQRTQPTQTPERSKFGTPPATRMQREAPTKNIVEIIDLAPELPEDDKAKAYVRCSNGTYKIFLFRYEMERGKLPLNPGEVLEKVSPPASLMKHNPPRTPIIQPTNDPFDSPLSTPTPNASIP